MVTGAEGHGIAKWLNQHRITGIVLEYRPPGGRAMVPLLDAQQALGFVVASYTRIHKMRNPKADIWRVATERKVRDN